jgi:hypothetical protein
MLVPEVAMISLNSCQPNLADTLRVGTMKALNKCFPSNYTHCPHQSIFPHNLNNLPKTHRTS